MKILDRYILTSFVSTLLTVFVILYFIFILQGIWLFISELAGKDLDVTIIAQFLLFYSPKMVPLVLPLSVLLASIMTFGSFAENYEFAAMKASGISLKRAMKPLSLFITALALLSFWFANNVIPNAEYKFINLRKEILQTKPAMAIGAGQFNDLGSVNIKVDGKSGEKGQYLDNVTMHIKSASGYENKAVIRSTNGELETNDQSNILKLHLFDGNYYEDVVPRNTNQQARHPFIQAKFDKYTMNIDIVSFQNEGKDEDKITNTYGMLNISELTYTIDSLKRNLAVTRKSNTANLLIRTDNIFKHEVADSLLAKKAPATILDSYEMGNKRRILQTAIDYSNNLVFNTESNDLAVYGQVKRVNEHYLALYEKFVIACSCFVMYFIGAPLGAIIRKGGLGLPIVFAVLIFIVYHFVNTFGRKLAQEDGIHPILGGWIGILVLTPLAIFLTIKATNDSGVINFETVFEPITKLFKKKDNNKKQQI